MIDYLIYHTPIYYLIQSVWRDEAFSYFMARPNILEIVKNTANDFNPPLYYLLLHFWINLVGRSDEGLRLLSFLPHLAGVYVAYLLAKQLTSKRFAVFVATFTFFNPMLLYYAFEMRMYSFYAFFTFLSLYFIYQKRWTGYLIAGILGLYSHSFYPLVIISYLAVLFLTKQLNKKNAVNILKPFIFYLPWMYVLINQFQRSQNSWIYPVDIQLIKSVLGNLFINYEGTPGDLWGVTTILSIIILFFLIIPLYNKKNLKKAYWAIIPIVLPLFLILGFSILRRPIFVNRYMIFVTVFEVIGISWGIWSIKNNRLRAATAALWTAFIVLVNLISPPYHKKTDFKSTFAEINRLANTSDFIYSKTPISFLESVYYYRNSDHVFIHNPDNISIPYYIGITVVFPNASRLSFPPKPSKTYLISDNAGYEIYINQ